MTVKTRTDRLIRQMKKPVVKSQPELKVPVGGSFFLPNQSGDHSQGVVTQAPVNDIDIPNKAYVDASGGEWTKDIPNTYLKPNTDGYAIRLYDSAGTDYGFIKSDGTYLDITSVGEHIRITSGGGFIFLLDDMDSRNIRPSSSSNFDLGLDSRVWENAHFEEVHIYDSTGAEHATITRDLNYFNLTSGTDSFGMKLQVATTDVMMSTTSYTNFYLEIRSYYNTDLGTAAKPFKDIYLNADVNWTTSYMRFVQIPSSGATVGNTAPTPTTIQNTRGLGFDADAEVVYIVVKIPPDWDAATDLTFCVGWCGTAGDAIADTETVKFDISYNSVAPTGGEVVDQGTEATATTTYTQSGAGTDKEFIKTDITIPYTGGNQPLAANDALFIKFSRDVTGDSYSGAAIVQGWAMCYESNAIPKT